MSYQVLARKWRPRCFEEMVGQQHVLKALTNALDNNRLHHAYLFTGTRGVGKTTLARIIAKCLNCEQGISSTPCGKCSACTSIDEGRFVDLIEVDAASRAKVDETRDLMDNVQYSPTTGRYKVYLIDEVHMFSGHSFNALLKTLEEPPPHVKFLLATTEAKKIPVTILSRCLQFNLKHLTVQQIEEQLIKITDDEKFKSDNASLHLIATAAGGSMRDALSLLDQAISHGGGQLEEEQVRMMLGTIDNVELLTLIQHLVAGDAAKVIAHAGKIAEHNPDYDAVLSELLSLFQQMAVNQVLNKDSVIGENPVHLDQLCKQISAEDIQLYYQLGLVGRRDLAYAPDPRAGFEMTLIRMLAFRPAGALKTIPQVTANQLPAGGSTSLTPENTATNSKSMPPASGTGEEKFTLQDGWQEIIDEMALAGLVKELAGHCILREHTRDRIHLVLSPAQEHLLKTSQKNRLKSALMARFGESINIIISVEDPEVETPTQQKDRKEKEKQQAAEKAIREDPEVKAIRETFDATLVENSIRPNS